MIKMEVNLSIFRGKKTSAEHVASFLYSEWPRSEKNFRIASLSKAASLPAGSLPAVVIMTVTRTNFKRRLESLSQESKEGFNETLEQKENMPDDLVVIGHSRVDSARSDDSVDSATHTNELSDGAAAIVFSVLIHPVFRKCGLGRVLMNHTEAVALAAGCSFVYLSTPDQERFYTACGYSVSKAVSSLGQNAKRLNSTQVGTCWG